MESIRHSSTEAEADEPSSEPSLAWSGDEHHLQVAAAKEAGLNPTDAAVDSYTKAFQAGLTVDHPDDHAIVLLGRTVLRERQLKKALLPLLQFLRIPIKEISLRVFDGKFELRISAFAAETAKASTERAKLTLQIWMASGVIGYLAYQSFEAVAAIIWGVGLTVGGLLLRNGLVSGRARLAARLALGLAMLAQEEKLILPPNDGDGT